MRSVPILAFLALLTAVSAAKATKVDLLSLGSATFPIDPESSFTPTQSATGLVMDADVVLGGNFYNGTPFTPVSSFDWSGFDNFGMTMTLLGGSPVSLGLNVSFFSASFELIDTYEGSTADLILVGAPVAANFTGISSPGSGEYSDVQYMQLTWAGAGAVNIGIQNVYGLTDAPAPAIGGSFTVRAPGGSRFLTSSNNTAGVVLPPNATTWASLSDSNAKTAVTEVDHRETLRKVTQLRVTSWRYKHEAGRDYLGPMAQDFREAFGLGFDNSHISTLDTDGVALSALKGLIEELKERQQRSAAQAKRLSELETQLGDLRDRIGDTLPPRP